jgi:hypothetical protein
MERECVMFDDLNQVTSTDPFTIGHVDRGRTAHIHGTGVFFDQLLFVHGENNAVRVFSRKNGHFGANPIARGTATASWGTSSPGGMPGGILALSANRTANAILWANEAFGNLPGDPDANSAPTPNILRAYDVSTVGTGTLQSIWDSDAEPNDRVEASSKFAPPVVANGKVYQATYDNQVAVYGLGAASSTPKRDTRRTVIFIYAQTRPGQDMFVRGGGKGGTPIRIRHRNWLNQHTNEYRWGDAYLDWGGGEGGQSQPTGGLGGGTPVEWTTSLAQGQGQPYVWMAGYGIGRKQLRRALLDARCRHGLRAGLRRWARPPMVRAQGVRRDPPIDCSGTDSGLGRQHHQDERPDATVHVDKPHGPVRHDQRVCGEFSEPAGRIRSELRAIQKAKLHISLAYRRAWRIGRRLEQYALRVAGRRKTLRGQRGANLPRGRRR